MKALIGDRPLANVCNELNASSLSGDRFNNTHFNVAHDASVLVNLIRGGTDAETNTTDDPNVEAVACRRGNDQRLVLGHKASRPATVRDVSGAAPMLKIDQGTGLAVHRLPFDGTLTIDGYGVAAVINTEPASTRWWEDRR